MINVVRLSGDNIFLKNLIDSDAYFRIVASYTKTCEIDNISSAGLPGMLEFTPAADIEALYFGKAKCLPVMPEAPTGPPSPVIIGLAVKNLIDFNTHFVDAGLKVVPDVPIYSCGVLPSKNILEGASVEAERLLSLGFKLAEESQYANNIEIISECVPGGTTTAYSLCKSLGYNCDFMFSSSSPNKEHSLLKKQIVDKAIYKFGFFDNALKCCEFYGDNMQPFVAGFVSKISMVKPVVLAGGTQMLAIIALMKKLKLNINLKNIAVITTKWVVKDKNSDFLGLANLIEPELNVFYSDFSMLSKIKNLKLYEEGMVKEGVGAGALIAYAFAKGVNSKLLLSEIEDIYKKLFVNEVN